MTRHILRLLAVVLVAAGLIVHIGLGYQFGLVIAGIGLAGHIAAGLVTTWLLRRRKRQAVDSRQT